MDSKNTKAMRLEDFCRCGRADCPFRDGQEIAEAALEGAGLMHEMLLSLGGGPKFHALVLLTAAKLAHADYMKEHPDGDSLETMVAATTVGKLSPRGGTT